MNFSGEFFGCGYALQMERFSQDIGLLVLRFFGGGTMLLAHGLGKLFDFKDRMHSFPDPLGLGSSLSLGLAIFAEVGCAVLLVLGVFTRLASIPLLVTMLVAFFIVHSGDPFARKELAFLFMGIYLALFFLGGGRYSLYKAKNPWLS